MSDHQSAQPTIDSEVRDILLSKVHNCGGDNPRECMGVINKAAHNITNLIAQEANKACLKQLKKLWGHAREHTITDIEMIMHQTGGKVDFIEAVDTKYFEERYQALTADKEQTP